MNLNPFTIRGGAYALAFYALLVFAICAGTVLAVFTDNRHVERIDALSPGPYVIERDDGVQLFAMPDGDAWTAEIGFAQRYGTLAQAQIARARIGAGHVAPVREVVR